MNTSFRNLEGKQHRTTRSKLGQLITNLVTQAGIEEKGVISCCVSTGRYKTDINPETNGVQLRSYGASDLVVIAQLNKTLFGATIQFKNGGVRKFVDFMKGNNEAKTEMPVMTGNSLFEKSQPKPQPQKVSRPSNPVPVPPSKQTKPPVEPPTKSTGFNLQKDGVSLAFLAIVHALDEATKPFQKGEAYEWLVDAKIGIRNNRMAGRVLSALLRTEVLEEKESGVYTLTPLGEEVSKGAEFPEVPREKRTRRVKATDEPEPSPAPEPTSGDENVPPEPEQTPTVPTTEDEELEQEPQVVGLKEILDQYLIGLEEERKAREAYFKATSHTIWLRALLAKHLPEETILRMEALRGNP